MMNKQAFRSKKPTTRLPVGLSEGRGGRVSVYFKVKMNKFEHIRRARGFLYFDARARAGDGGGGPGSGYMVTWVFSEQTD